MNIDYPFAFDVRGRTAETVSFEEHVRDLIEQVLFTSPGERVNRPDFGSGLLQLVFAPNSEALAATLQLTVQSSLQEWLGDLIVVEGVQVRSAESSIEVSVRYVIRRNQQTQFATFQRSL